MPTLYGQIPGTTITVGVPATSNPYLAGMPRGTKATFGDTAPEESPVLVELTLVNAVAVSFSASGAVEHDRFDPPQYDPPDGSMFYDHKGGAENGIANVSAPIDSLVGVFLGDDRPDRTRAPKPLRLRSADRDGPIVSPDLKQVFFIGAGATKSRVSRRYMVPRDATRLFLGVMDGYEWNNNAGSFAVRVTMEYSDVSSNLFSVDSQISYAEWPCLPDRSQCTPGQPIVKETRPGEYHVILPAQMEWGVSVPTPTGATATISGAVGTACLDAESRSTSSCNGPSGDGTRAGTEYVAPNAGVGALVSKTTGGRTYFAVNDRRGASFQNHQGYFEFDVNVK